MLEVELPVSKQQPVNDHLHKGKFEHIPILELNGILMFTQSFDRVHAQFNLGLYFPERPIPPPFHKVRRDGWVVADLFDPDGAAVDPALVGLTQ